MSLKTNLVRDVSMGYSCQSPKSVARQLLLDMSEDLPTFEKVGVSLAMLIEALENGAKARSALDAISKLVSMVMSQEDSDEVRALLRDYQEFLDGSSSVPVDPMPAV